MSYQDGLAAINLEMPTRVPRTEYSADTHWALVSAVTGIEVDASSPAELKSRARVAFRRAWNYDFNWEILGLSQVFGDMRTKMGHAVYASGGVDFSPEVVCPFKEPEEVLRFDPWEAYGQQDRRKLTRDFENHYRKVCDYDPDAVNTTGIYVTCVSGLIEIFGWEMLLLTVGLDPEGFGEVANRYASWIQQYFDALGDANVPVVMVHDDIAWTSGPVFHPEYRMRLSELPEVLWAVDRQRQEDLVYVGWHIHRVHRRYRSYWGSWVCDGTYHRHEICS